MLSSRVIASLVLCASIALGAIHGVNLLRIENKGNFVPASFDSYEVTLVDGETLNMNLAGGRIIFDSSADRDYMITLTKCKTLRVAKNLYGYGGVFDLNISDYMNEDDLYYITVSYEAYGRSVSNGNNIVFFSGNELHFWRSSSYYYNVEACSELWTDEQSLKECLEPQNDIECDDPVLIAYSDRICEGASDDWEKVYRIYEYIAHEMAYDDVEVAEDSGGYQDGAVAVIRDGKSICEGFANTFVALCRAQGIPSCVEFGMGLGSYEEMTENTPDDNDYSDHAWAAVFLGDKWHFVDPTYDMSRYYEGPGNIETYESSMQYYLLPLESFSNDHRIMDADTRHGIPSAGQCGDYATYEITRDGVCYISGSGTLKMPSGVNGFSKIVFDEDCTIDVIGSNCFGDCDLITSVILPDSVRRIEKLAFNTCEDLEYIYIPDGCGYIGEQAFDYCDELSYVRVPDSVTWIGQWAFDDCPRLYLSLPALHSDLTRLYDMQPMYIEYR